MWITVEPVGFRPEDLQLVSGVQSEGKLYEWLSILAQCLNQAAVGAVAAAQASGWQLDSQVFGTREEKKVPPWVREVYKGYMRREVTG